MRPMPPDHLSSATTWPGFSPALDMPEWAHAMFIDEGSELENEDYLHLRSAEIGFLWTNTLWERRGMMLLGTCEMVMDSGGNWPRGRGLHQLRNWFGGIPDFVITFYAPTWAMMSDRQAFALVEHELHHTAHALDKYGNPRFSKEDGRPVYAMRGHDFEDFTGVVERYGTDNPALRTAAESIMAGPLFTDDVIRIACGTCAAR